MNTLVIQHIPESDPPAFMVARHEPHTLVPAQAVVAPPDGYQVEGSPNSDLRRELRWYLEQFLDYPFPPQTEHAEFVQNALKAWGTQAFEALFGAGQARDFYHDAVRDGHDNLQLRITGNDPLILAWPWEALHDPQHGYLAHHCHIERQLTNVGDPLPLPENLPQDRVNILLVTARPFEGDVKYRSISRPLVDLIAKNSLPAEVTLLRPPTLDRLQHVLHERPGYFHIVHFDGHGGYGEIANNADAAASLADAVSPHSLQGPQGCLVFETAEGKPHPVPAETLSTLMRVHRIPAVVLNACQSAAIDERAEDAFASVAASFVRAGVRSVVAMAYSLYVSGAQHFLPAFYRRLFECGDFAEPTREGRKAMLAHPGRVCARGEYPLADWMVPVVYQQQAAGLEFLVQPSKPAAEPKDEDEAGLPDEAKDEQNPYGFIGRDGAVLAMERAWHKPTPAILINGLGGVGKTTLARGFVRWLQQTNGLGNGCFWFTFNDIRSADFVLNQMGVALAGSEFNTWSAEKKVQWLGQAFHENPFVLVWDNFESASGNEAAGIDALLPAEDRQTLLALLRLLRGGKTKVIITSRSDESWLPADTRIKLELGGLIGEERWEYCTAILSALNLRVSRDDPDVVKLMDWLNGHPLLMRAVLTRLEDRPAGSVLGDLRGILGAPGAGSDESLQKLQATLGFVDQGLPEEVRPLLVPLALHERFVNADHLEHMSKQCGQDASARAAIDRCLGALGTAGLVRDRGQAIYELHPALTSHLRETALALADEAVREAWVRAFADLWASIADQLAPKNLHQQRINFSLHGANFHTALGYAEQYELEAHFAALTQLLAAYAQNTRNYDEADRLFLRLAAHHETRAEHDYEAVAYHQLGMIATERRQFDRAEAWHLKSLAIQEKQGNESGVARTYHQLGRIDQERRQLDQAEQWYHRSRTISEKLGDEEDAAQTYHQLGTVALVRRQYAPAEEWYLKALAIKENQGNEHGAVSTYHQLGMIAQERRKFDQAEEWNLKALAISARYNDEHRAAQSYHQLGRIAEEQRQFERAEAWYLKALAIVEKEGTDQGGALTYHQLGMIAHERRQFEQAEAWYFKSLAISAKLGDEHGAALSYHQLGMIAQEQRQFEQAEYWYLKSLTITEKQGDGHRAANTCALLGLLAAGQENCRQAGEWLIKATKKFVQWQDQHLAAHTAGHFKRLYHASSTDNQAKLCAMWKEAGLSADLIGE